VCRAKGALVPAAGREKEREDRRESGAVHFPPPAAGLSVERAVLSEGFVVAGVAGFGVARLFASALPAKRSMMNPTRSFASTAASP
jgi:hypothetical protein